MKTNCKQRGKKIIAILLCLVLCASVLSACVGTSDRATEIVSSHNLTKLSYEIGEQIDYEGLKVQAKLENGLFRELSSNEYEINSDFDSTKAGDYTVNITYKTNDKLKTNYKVSVNQSSVLSLTINNPPDKQIYEIGESLDYSGIKLQKSISSSATVNVDLSECYISTDFDSKTAGIYQVTILLIEDSSKKVTYSVTVNEAHVDNLKLNTDDVKINYGVGEELNFAGLTVTQIMSDGNENVLNEEDYTVASPNYDKLSGGKYDVVVSLKSDSKISAEYSVYVIAVSDSLRITSPAKTNYNRNENISYDGLAISEVLDDGTEIPLKSDEYIITTDYDKTLGGEYTVNIKLKSNADISTSYTVTVAKTVSSISVKAKPTKTSYELKEAINLEGLIVQKSYNDYSKENIAETDYTVDVSKFDNTRGGTYKITITLKNSILTTYFNVTVVKHIVSCEWDGESAPNKTVYELNEIIDIRNDTSGLKLMLTYNDGSESVANKYAYKYESDHNKLQAGKYSVTISFNTDTYEDYIPVANFTYMYEITVREPIVNGLSILKYPNKMVYSNGEELALDGLAVQKVFSDGTIAVMSTNEYKTTNEFDPMNIGQYIITITYNADDKIYVEFSVAVTSTVSSVQFESNISDKMQILGSKYTFDFTAKENDGTKISTSDIKATIDGNATISLTWSDSEKDSYTIELNNDIGEYKIVFTIKDSKDNIVIKTYNITHPSVNKGDKIGQVTFAVEAFTIGHGYIIEPTIVDMYEGENCVYSLARVIRNNGYCFTYSGKIESGFYIQRIISGKSHTISNCACKELNGIIPIINPKALLIDIAPPQNIIDFVGELDVEDYTQGSLGEFDLSSMSGWMYTVNNAFPSVGFADCYPNNGDVIRAQFTLAYGSDIGGWGSGYFDLVNRDKLTAMIAKINMGNAMIKMQCAEEYNAAIAILAHIGIDQMALDNALTNLTIAYDKAVL